MASHKPAAESEAERIFKSTIYHRVLVDGFVAAAYEE